MKRGQITIFIILGIVLLLSLAGYVVISKNSKIFQPKDIVPTELKPLQIYIESCLEEKTTAGATLMGIQGGYIRIPTIDPDKTVSLIPNMPNSKKIPYWYTDRAEIPSKAEMNKELSTYVTTKIEDCITLESFSNEYDIKKGIFSAKVNINRDDILVELTYPLELKQKGTTKITEISKFVTSIPIRLGRMHDMAILIMNEENTNNFLEELTMDMISSANTENGRFPYEGTEISCSTKTWSIQNQLIPDLQKILKYNFHFLKFQRSSTFPLIAGTYQKEVNGKIVDTTSQLENYYYGQRVRPDYIDSEGKYPSRSEYKINYLVDLGEAYPNIEVTTLYDEIFGMDMKVYPSSGGRVKAMKMSIPIIGSCVKIYHHFYTIEYPIVFILKDTKKPFTFQFATPVIIEKNVPNRKPDLFSKWTGLETIGSEEYCNSKEHLMELKAQDSYTGDNLDEVDITYQCLNFACEQGLVKKDLFQGTPVGIAHLKTEYPVCINGILSASKDGYLDFKETLSIGDSNNPAPKSKVIELKPLKKIKHAYKILEISGGVLQGSRPLEKDEIIIITVKNKDHELNLIYPTEVEQFKNLELMAMNTKYDLSIKLIKNDVIIGGYELLNWEYSRDELMLAKKIVFNVLVKENPDMTKDWVEFIQRQSKKKIYYPELE